MKLLWFIYEYLFLDSRNGSYGMWCIRRQQICICIISIWEGQIGGHLWVHIHRWHRWLQTIGFKTNFFNNRHTDDCIINIRHFKCNYLDTFQSCDFYIDKDKLS